MAPARKSKSLNKCLSYINEVSPTKEADSSKKSGRKRKLTNLGPQWSKDELICFYEAYRKHGKEWKKVAAAVRNRSIDMVEAIYTMNRAYLSLPEGTASVVGLIAMMTDHYCNLVGSDSEQESYEFAESSRKPSKRPRAKFQHSTPKAPEINVSSPPINIANTFGCLSLCKKKRSGGSRSRAVGKRTPRFPVSFSYDNKDLEKYLCPNRLGFKMKGNNNEDEVAHEIALALAEASHRGGSSQASQTPNKRTGSNLSSPMLKSQWKYSKLEASRSKPEASDTDEEDLEGSMEADTGELSKVRTYLMESGNDSKLFQKSRLLKLEVDENSEDHLDEITEACSGTEESQRLGVGRGKFETEVSDAKSSRSPVQGSRKRSKKILFSKDEESAVDALQTLADLSLMMPGSDDDDELMMHVKNEFDDHVDESGSLEAIPRGHSRNQKKSPAGKLRTKQTISRVAVASSRASKLGKTLVVENNTKLEGQLESNHSTLRRKQNKAISSKTRKIEFHVEENQNESQELEGGDVGKKNLNKMRKPSQSPSPTLVKNNDDSVCNGLRREGSDSALSAVQPFVVNQANLSTKVRNRRKNNLKKPQMLKSTRNILLDQTNDPISSVHDKASYLKKILSNLLANERAQNWCIYEWFYSAMDYPWFAKREFVEYLDHVGLGHVPRLTRVEWGVIRSSLGKPRRFSEHFLKEEKQKLNQYRESVRTHYTELCDGIREGLPTDLAKPLSVGQRVIAIHPKNRQLHDGSVLTVDRSRCRVQFDRPELGVEFVKDVHCMPLNPIDNMPASIFKHTVGVDKLLENWDELNLNGHVKEYTKCPRGAAMENVNGFSHLSPSAYGLSVLNQTEVGVADSSRQARIGVADSVAYQYTPYSYPNVQAQNHAKEVDVQALAELTRSLDKKEAVVLELRRMNDDVAENQKDGKTSLQDSEPFKKQYAAILVQLHEANEQVSSAIYFLRQRNTYQEHIPATLLKHNANHMDPSGLINSFDLATGQSHESGSNIKEIIESSKTKARTMVDVAIQAMCTLKVDDKTEEAIDYVNDQITSDDSCMPTVPEIKSRNVFDEKETEIPSELISQCVATLLMIQKCTERQFPPANVAQILDSAVAGLQPCSSMNLSTYAEIQKCMGIIRNQILALIPT